MTVSFKFSSPPLLWKELKKNNKKTTTIQVWLLSRDLLLHIWFHDLLFFPSRFFLNARSDSGLGVPDSTLNRGKDTSDCAEAEDRQTDDASLHHMEMRW